MLIFLPYVYAYSSITCIKEFFKLHTIWNILKQLLKYSYLHLLLISALLLLTQSQIIKISYQSFPFFVASVYISAVYLSVSYFCTTYTY